MPEAQVDYFDADIIESGVICCKMCVDCPDHGGEGYAFFNSWQELAAFLGETIRQELSVASDVNLDTEENLLAGAKEYLGEFEGEDLGDSEFVEKTEPLVKLFRLIKRGPEAPGQPEDPSDAVDLFNDFFSEYGEEIRLELMTLEEILDEVDLDETVRGMKRLQRLLDDGEFDCNDASQLKLAKKAIPRPTWE